MQKPFLSLLFILLLNNAFSQDRYFARTYTSNVLPKGNFDIELWHTSRFGHNNQYFHAMDQRMEFEVGLGHQWQTAFYFNRYQKSFSDSTGSIVQENEIGFSNEWKWHVTRPESRTGIALYGELGVKGDELELETKLIADRSFGKNLVAFNLIYELEAEAKRKNLENEFELEETPIELDFAFMHQFSTSFGAGIELADHNDIKKGKWENSVLYAGPTINYRGDRWFFIANYLPQLSNLHQSIASPKNRVLDVHEKAEARILFGFSF